MTEPLFEMFDEGYQRGYNQGSMFFPEEDISHQTEPWRRGYQNGYQEGLRDAVKETEWQRRMTSPLESWTWIKTRPGEKNE